MEALNAFGSALGALVTAHPDVTRVAIHPRDHAAMGAEWEAHRGRAGYDALRAEGPAGPIAVEMDDTVPRGKVVDRTPRNGEGPYR